MENIKKLQGIKNFAQNIKPIMLKIKDGEKLTASELHSILQFYLEVVDYLSNRILTRG